MTMKHPLRGLGVACALSLLLCLPTAATAQPKADPPYPDRPVHLIVPFTAGGGSDAAARFFGEKLSEALGQPFLVENRPGGVGGSISVLAVKKAPPDGYTILVGSSSPLVTNAVMVKDLGYDPAKDFRPVSGLTKNSTVVVVPAESAIHSLADLVAAAKKDPTMSSGTGSVGFQLATAWLAAKGGFQFTNVPYKGLNPLLVDVAGNHLDWAIVDLAGATPLLRSGRIRAIAIADEQRHRDFPDVPTVIESGFPGYQYNTWTSLHVRADTPDHIVRKLSAALQAALASPAAKDFARNAGTDLLPLDEHAFAELQKAELERFRQVAATAGIEKQ